MKYLWLFLASFVWGSTAMFLFDDPGRAVIAAFLGLLVILFVWNRFQGE